MRRYFLATAAILTVASGCDNVAWGGVEMELMPPPPAEPGTPAEVVAEPEEPAPPPEVPRPLLLAGTRDDAAATLVVVGELGDSGVVSATATSLANGATQVMYEGTPDSPHKGRWWEICERYGVTIFYTAPTAIRTFMKWGDDIPAKFDLSAIRLLGSVGEPINPEAYVWYRENIGGGKVPVVDTWW